MAETVNRKQHELRNRLESMWWDAYALGVEHGIEATHLAQNRREHAQRTRQQVVDAQAEYIAEHLLAPETPAHA